MFGAFLHIHVHHGTEIDPFGLIMTLNTGYDNQVT